MKLLHQVLYIFLWVGGVNWGLVGFFNYNLVEMLTGASAAKLVYMVVGVAAVYTMTSHMQYCKWCADKKK